ncbi:MULTISPECIES: aldo/keto reductase [Streptomyces]|uniref:aldo/keto reductase n=1 Tax=Streptomyces TaxID=1883 RepID=UPI002E809B6C|nr:aldo/keto reductase [Streptomyces sp. NBC_00582]WUB60943.1 aldo/keto reductase [Streptomyces sp. NBC_00582]
MTQHNPTLTLNNGVEMPALGLGVYQSSPEETAEAVHTALRTGYRLIDTAAAYFNEEQVGEGIRRSGVDREEAFVTTKLWISDYGYEPALRAFDASLRRLGLDYIDLYLLHWPVPSDLDAAVASYQAAQKLLAEGRARAIGVCNHSPQHLATLVERTEVVPAVNQVELHPYFTQRAVREAGARHGTITQSWSPIGGVNVYATTDAEKARNVLQDPVIRDLVETHGRTAAQIVLRWHLQNGLSAILKSVHANRIKENFDVFDFSLSASEMAAIDGLDTGVRGGPDPEQVDTEMFPLTVEN